MSFRKSTSVATIAFLTIVSAAPLAHAQSVGVGVGSRGGVRVGGGAAAGPDPLLNSAALGAVLGSAGGPIGMAIGAGVGLVHGLWARRKYEEQARAEQERQRAMDRELEREMAAQRAGGPADTEDGQGVLIIADNLATSDAPSASPSTERATQVASLPPASSGASATSRTPDGVDAEGFRPVYEDKRLVRREHRAPDGSVDVVLHYDTRGRIVRRDESSKMDGRLDTSAYYVDGTLQRKESDTDGDRKPDVWAFYDGTGDLTRLESLTAEGKRRIEQYRSGRVAERLDGDLLSVFDDSGHLVKQGRKGADEKMLAWRYYEQNGDLAREEEFDADGSLTAVAHYEGGRIVRRELYKIDDAAFSRVPLVSPGAAPDAKASR